MEDETQTPLTFEEHRELSSELQNTQRRLIELGKMADEVYGVDSPASIALTQAAEAIGRLRYELQLQAAEDCPGRRASDFYR